MLRLGCWVARMNRGGGRRNEVGTEAVGVASWGDQEGGCTHVTSDPIWHKTDFYVIVAIFFLKMLFNNIYLLSV